MGNKKLSCERNYNPQGWLLGDFEIRRIMKSFWKSYFQHQLGVLITRAHNRITANDHEAQGFSRIITASTQLRSQLSKA